MLLVLYPFGLNERLEIPKYMDAKEEFDKRDTPIYSYFHKDLQKNETRKRGKRNKKSNRHTAKESFDLLWEKVRKESQDILKQMVTIILRLKKVECLKLARIIEDAICRLNTKTHNIQILKSMQDLCRYYLYRTKVIPTQPERGTFLSIKYSSQILERINFSRILNSMDIKQIFPLDAEAQSSITVCYSYGRPIRNKILNYKSCLVEETVDLQTLQCDCNQYPELCDSYHGHIITGNLKVVKNRKLRNLLSKGLNHREQLHFDQKLFTKDISKSLDGFIDKHSVKYKIAKDKYAEWKRAVMNAVQQSIVNTQGLKRVK